MLGVAVVAIAGLLALPEPDRPGAPTRFAVVPTWSGPMPMTVAGRLGDGQLFRPRAYVNPETSVGTAETSDGAFQRLVLRGPGDREVELRRVPSADLPQFDGFVVAGETLVWAESLSQSDQAIRTTLWRSNWSTGAKAALITSDAGEADFFGGQYDLVVQEKKVYWAAVASGGEHSEIRSVSITGGPVSVQRLDGLFGLSAWPWIIRGGGRGAPVVLVNLTDGKRIEVPTKDSETATCNPVWCRMGVLEGSTVVRFDIQRTDGSQRRRMAGDEATPSIVDVALLDRFIPLTTDRGEEGDRVGVGLSLYDITTGDTELVAIDVANIHGRDSMLWWSTGIDDELSWHAIDLRELT